MKKSEYDRHIRSIKEQIEWYESQPKINPKCFDRKRFDAHSRFRIRKGWSMGICGAVIDCDDCLWTIMEGHWCDQRLEEETFKRIARLNEWRERLDRMVE